MTTTQRAVTVAALLLVVAVAGFLYLRSSNTQADFPTGPTTTTVTAATTTTTTAVPTRTVTDPDDPTTTTTAVPTRTVTDPDDPTTTTTTAATTAEPDSGDEPTTTTTATAEPDGGDEPATTTTTATTVVTVTDPDDPEKCVPASTTVQMPPEPDEWWLYDPELEWPVTDPGRLTTENVYPSGLIEDAVGVAQQVEAFWAWYMTWGHCQGAALDLSQADHRVWLEGDAVDQLMYAHHRFWQQRLPVWQDVWNREFETARDEQRNKLIYLDALRDLDRGVDPVGPSTLLYNPSDETSVWRYWGPIIRPVPNPTAPQRSGELILPDDILGVCDPGPDGPNPLAPVSWDCAHLGPAEGTALGDWDVGWYYDIPHEHAAWYVSVRTSDSPGLVRYDPDVHGVPTSQFGEFSVDGGSLRYLPATVADGAGWTDVVEALKPYRPEGFPTDPDGYQQMWRYDVGGGWWHKEMGQLVLLVPAAELVAWLEANGYDPQQMFAQGWPNPEEETLIRNTWGKDWDPTNPADWRNRLADGVGWLEQGVEIGDSGNLAADIEAAIHISAWMDWAYRARLRGDQLPPNDLTGGWYPSAWAPGVTIRTAQDAADATFAHRPDGWATQGGRWQGLYHQALADGYDSDAATGRLTHPALNPELAVWKEWAAAGEAEKWLGFQAADGDLGPAPGDTWIPWYPEEMVPLENHYLLPEHAVAHWETTVDWWPEGGLETPVHQPDWYHAFTVAGPYVAEARGHMFETCLWSTGGLFAAWSLPHPQLEDASQNVTWIVRGIADRDGRVVKLAEPVNRPCIDSVNRWQHEGQVPHRRSGVTNFDEYVEYLRTPIPEVLMERAYDPDTALWTAGNGHLVDLPSQLFDDGIITVHEVGWLNAVADAADSEPGVRALETSYEDWQQWGNRRHRNPPHQLWGGMERPADQPLPVLGLRMVGLPSGGNRRRSERVRRSSGPGGVGHPRPVHRLGPRGGTLLPRRVHAVHLPDRQPTPPARHALAVQRRNRYQRGHMESAPIRMGQMGRPPRKRNVAHRGPDNPPVRPTLGNGPDHPRRPHQQRGCPQRLVMGERGNALRLRRPRRRRLRRHGRGARMDHLSDQLHGRRVPHLPQPERLAIRRVLRVRSRSVRRTRMGLARGAHLRARQEPRRPCTGRLAAVDLGEPSRHGPGRSDILHAAARCRLRGNSRRQLHPRLHSPVPRPRELSALAVRYRRPTPRILVRHRQPVRRIATGGQG